MKNHFTFALIFTVVLYGNKLFSQETSISLNDGHQLNANLVIVQEEYPSVLLLHQCNRTQKMWDPLVIELNKNGFNTVTVDSRGYGKSTSIKFNIDKHDYDSVTKHLKNDIDEINLFWRKVIPKSSYRIVIAASCGGGLACKSAVYNDDIKGLVLISPSLREHWINKEDKARFSKLNNLPLLLVASEKDYNAVKYIDDVFKSSNSKNSQKMVYKNKLHGEPLFTHDSELIPYIIKWILKVGAAKD